MVQKILYRVRLIWSPQYMGKSSGRRNNVSQFIMARRLVVITRSVARRKVHPFDNKMSGGR